MQKRRYALRCAVWFALLLSASGCARRDYRLAADRDAYGLITGKLCPQWMLPARAVEASDESRLADLSDPDCPPLPPDDRAASCLMAHPYRFQAAKTYRQRARVPFIEYPTWQDSLPRDEEGQVTLDGGEVVPLAILHSRSYQTEYEQVYLSALDLSLERFNFDIQWSAGTGAIFDAIGNKSPPGTRSLTLPSQAGFSRNFAGGGQLLVDFANTFLWEFSGGQFSRASSGLLVQLTQPLLRGAFREVRLESLTQSERDLLYATRQFARFRRQFYVDIKGDGGYLGLLSLAQAIRNQQKTLASLERNLQEHQALAAAGLVAPIQVDQVYQDYEQGRLRLLAANQSLQSALDRYKLRLGLPPTLEVRIDDKALRPFELSEPRMDELEADNETLRLSLLRYDRENLPSLEFLDGVYQQLDTLMSELPALLKMVQSELEEWQRRLEADGVQVEDEKELERRQQLAEDLEEYLIDSFQKLLRDQQALEQQIVQLPDTPADIAWANLKLMSGENFRERLADLFVVQSQLRVYLIEIEPVEIDAALAMAVAKENRLDLMNARGRVIDSLRRVEVAADALEGDLDLVLETELRTDPDRTNAFRFDSSAHRYRAGLRFDGPLNRMAERNVYRATQIGYQQSRRDFMATHDNVEREIREDLRQLEFDRFSFEVTRRQLITAVRQVEEAQFGLRSSTEPDSSLTRDLLSALQQLLSAKNSLISSWTSYETSRMNLFRDLGWMQVDGEGVWINEYDAITAEAAEQASIAPLPGEFLGVDAISDVQFSNDQRAELQPAGLNPAADIGQPAPDPLQLLPESE